MTGCDVILGWARTSEAERDQLLAHIRALAWRCHLAWRLGIAGVEMRQSWSILHVVNRIGRDITIPSDNGRSGLVCSKKRRLRRNPLRVLVFIQLPLEKRCS